MLQPGNSEQFPGIHKATAIAIPGFSAEIFISPVNCLKSGQALE